MKSRKLAALLTSGVILFSSCTAYATSQLIQPYASPQGIYEDKDIAVQIDVDSDFHIAFSLTNKTDSVMSIPLDRAFVCYNAISPDISFGIHEIGQKQYASIPPKGHIELSLATSEFEGAKLPLGPGLGIKLSIPIKIADHVKDFTFLFEKVRPSAESVDKKEQPLQAQMVVQHDETIPNIALPTSNTEDHDKKVLDQQIKDNISMVAVEKIPPVAKEQNKPNKQTVEVSFKKYHTHYQEEIPDYETGWMHGMHFSYKNQNQNTKQYWRVLYETTNHNDQYIGGLQNMLTGAYLGDYQTITENKITNREIIFANPITDSENAYAYIGIGFHNWDRNILGSASLGVSSLLEKYSWKYIPIGYRNEYKINNKWDGAVDMSLRFMFNGKMKVPNLSSIDPLQVNLGSKIGFKLEIPYTYHMNSNWSFVIKPWYEYWEIGKSNVVPQTVNGVPNGSGVYEPASKTNQLGVDIGVSCSF